MCEVNVIAEYNSKFSSIGKEKTLLSKTCPCCKREFSAESKRISKAQFEKLTYCSVRCEIDDNREALPDTKICPVCKKEFKRPFGADGRVVFYSRWKAKIHCSFKCMGIANRGDFSEGKVCAQCGETYYRRTGEGDGKKEAITTFRQGKYCSRSCHWDSQSNKLKNGNFVCGACGEEKEVGDFYTSKLRRHGITKTCKSCLNERSKEKWEGLSLEERTRRSLSATLGTSRVDIPDELIDAQITLKKVTKELNGDIVSKGCLNCGKEFFLKDFKVSASIFRSKTYCSFECSVEYRFKKNNVKKKRQIEVRKTAVRTCVKCSTEFTPRDDEPLSNFNIRKFCSKDCRTNANKNIKVCIVCNEKFERPLNLKGHMMVYGKWKKKECCSRSCGCKNREQKKKELANA